MKPRREISLVTRKAGYSLTVDGTDFLYFSEIELMAGLLAHVGMGENNPVEKSTILSSLFAAMLGSTYTDAVATLKQRVGLLTSQYTTTIQRMDDAIAYVTQAEKQIDGMMKRLDVMEAQMKGTEAEHEKNKKVVDEVKVKLDHIKDSAIKVMESLSNSATIMAAMEEVGSTAKEKKASVKSGDNGKKKKGSRNEADDALIEAEIKKNPNIK